MVKIIEQLLTLARSDAGQEAHAIEHVDLGEMLRGLAADFKVVFNDKGLSLELDTGNKAVVEGDVLKLKRLFANVLDNAARYTPGGGTISITLFADKKDAVVRIRDTGVGISPEHLPFIFNRFYRVDKARSRADGGSGLGLAICRQIAEEHGGEIYAESEVGKGSSFSVKLPLAHIAR
jgi:signal transduction histidine kinase